MQPLHFLSAAIFENRIDVGTQPILEKITVALLQAELVVVNYEEAIHDCIIGNFC